MRRLPTGTVTFLFTDIEGSTRLLLELGDRYATVLAEHHRLLRRVWAQHRGVELETAGDAFFVAFARASDAVAAAAEAQQVLEPTPVRIRVGIHTGEPLLAETGYVGVAVHQAARIASAGHGGQVVLSQETRELVDAEVIDLGVHRVKDFPERLRLFQLGKGVFPPLQTVAATNLPRPASTFVGRTTELKAVVTLLGRHRLVTLSGAGGSGKTRLAIEAASKVVAEFGNGVYWVPLASLADATLVLDTIKQVVGAKEDLTDYFGGRRALLLLDNFEQVIDAAPELASLVAACPELHVLVTSRERLRLQGEVEYAVDPLERAEAVELFCVRAQTEPDEIIDELCARLDDLPLALELAAARASAFPAAQIVERISGRLDLLKGGRDAEARHATLRATIEWSHELLGVGEQQLFRRLSVFVGGCTLDAAEAVGGADLDTLASLVEKSLARRTGERYWMLETIRAYALERLDASGEGDDLRLAHARFFADVVVKGEPELRGPRQEEWFERLTTEHGNVRAALEWLASSSEAPLHARLAGSCWYFWYVTGQFGEAHRRLTAALEAAVDVDPELVAGLHDGLSAMSAMRGESASALRHAEESLAIRRRGGSRQALLRSLLNRAGLAESARGVRRRQVVPGSGSRQPGVRNHVLRRFRSRKGALGTSAHAGRADGRRVPRGRARPQPGGRRARPRDARRGECALRRFRGALRRNTISGAHALVSGRSRQGCRSLGRLLPSWSAPGRSDFGGGGDWIHATATRAATLRQHDRAPAGGDERRGACSPAVGRSSALTDGGIGVRARLGCVDPCVMLPTGTVTFLFTDIEGSTRLLHDLGEGYADLLAEHHRLLRSVWSSHSGIEIDTQGDAFFVVFERASDAVAAAGAAQDALEPTGLRVRIGLHTGEPMLTETGYVGMDVHRAARITAAGHGGQVLLSQTTHDLVAVPGLRDLGEHALRDLRQPERIWQLGETEFPPHAADRARTRAA